jgi:hypothetical protein
MLRALIDLENYATSYSLNPSQLAAIGDFDDSASVTNRDLQGLSNYVASLDLRSIAGVPEPTAFVLALVDVTVIAAIGQCHKN